MLQTSEHHGLNTPFRKDGKDEFTAKLSRASNGCHVLVVHHHPDTLHMIAAMFRRLEYKVSTARDSAEALICFGRKTCDLLFADLEMPLLDGYHLACLIKKNSPQAKAVIMTCRCQAELVGFMKDGTIDGWLFKPFKISTFKKTLVSIGLDMQTYIHPGNRHI